MVAVKVALARWFPEVTPRDELENSANFRGFKSNWRTAPQAGSGPHGYHLSWQPEVANYRQQFKFTEYTSLKRL